MSTPTTPDLGGHRRFRREDVEAAQKGGVGMSALDPSVIAKGDTVTLTRGPAHITDVVRSVERLDTGATLVTGLGVGGPWAIQKDGTGWLLTARIPAAPFPIGTPGTATVAWGDETKKGRVFRKAHGFIIGAGEFVEPTENGADAWSAGSWSDFVPDDSAEAVCAHGQTAEDLCNQMPAKVELDAMWAAWKSLTPAEQRGWLEGGEGKVPTPASVKTGPLDGAR